MKSNLLLFIVLFLGLQITAQTIVSTEIENRNALFEEYTGIACGFCPMGHLEIANFMALPIKTQVFFHSFVLI